MNHKIALRVVVSLLFLSYLIFQINWTSLFETLSSVQPVYFLLSFLFALLNSFVLAQKYKVLMKPTGLYQPFLTLVKINFISRFYAMFLTTAVGHGIIRWYKVTKNQEGRSKFIAVMVLERLTFLFTIFCATILAITILAGPELNAIEQSMLPFLWAGLACLFLLFFCFLYSPFHAPVNKSLIWVSRRLPNSMRRFLDSVDFSVPYRYERILLAILFALIWHLLFLLRVYLLFLSLDVPLGFLDVTWMASLALLVQAVPVSFSGIGVRETAYAYLFKIQNLPPETGVLIGILFFSQMLIMSLIGGALELSSKA
jgi:uncharacterized protein (TIRG00374 family)